MSLRVLVVHDSPTARLSLRRALASSDLEIVGEGSDGDEAAALVARTSPDVVLMDIVMPRMDGYAATRAVMATQPTPIVLISSVVATRDVSVAMEALRAGALAVADALPAPSDPSFAARCSSLAQLLRAMANVNVKPRASAAKPTSDRAVAPAVVHASTAVIGIVASTGGPQMIHEILRELPKKTAPPILVVQHIAKGFTEGFAQWLAGSTGHRVIIPRDGDIAERAVVYIAPEGLHLGLDNAMRLVLDSENR